MKHILLTNHNMYPHENWRRRQQQLIIKIQIKNTWKYMGEYINRMALYKRTQKKIPDDNWQTYCPHCNHFIISIRQPITQVYYEQILQNIWYQSIYNSPYRMQWQCWNTNQMTIITYIRYYQSNNPFNSNCFGAIDFNWIILTEFKIMINLIKKLSLPSYSIRFFRSSDVNRLRL